MKLLLITAVVEFKKDIQQILRTAQVHSYSYKDVIGFKNAAEDDIEANWFATKMTENESVFFYAFVTDEKVAIVIKSTNDFNTQQQSLSHIHVASMNIEQSN